MSPVRERPTWGLVEGDELAPGRTVLRRLGSGRCCETLLVWDDHRLAVLVAKVLRPDRTGDARAFDELRREAELLGRLGHPVVVRGFGAYLDGRFPHLVMEHLEGPTLLDLIERHGPVALEQLLPLGLHIASALHYLAAEGVVHLDVKPSNVVMGIPPRLIDLGVARSVAEARILRRPTGTPGYMAPEQLAPGAEIGPRTDVYGLGATLHHAVTGHWPSPPAPLPPRTPQPVAELLDAMLAPDPAARPAAAEVAAGLEPVVADLRPR